MLSFNAWLLTVLRLGQQQTEEYMEDMKNMCSFPLCDL